MATLKKFNLSGESVGEIEANEVLAQASANSQMVKDYIVALRANARQWSASTKGRSEVVHTTKKPHPQKGGGRARQGSLVSPQYRGGGVVFGPKPKFDQHVRINKKERRAAIRSLIGEKIRENKLVILESTDMREPKTKVIADLLAKNELTGRTLILGESSVEEFNFEEHVLRINMPSTQHENFIKSLRNIPKVQFALASNISGYDVIIAKNLIVTEGALNELINWLC